MLTFTAHTECVSATEEPPVCNVWICTWIWIGNGKCRHCVWYEQQACVPWSPHGCCATCIHTFPNWVELHHLFILHDLFILLLVSDLPTVRQFLLKQTQLKCVMFGDLYIYDTKDVIDTVKVLKCYSEIATWFADFSKSLVSAYLVQCGWSL